MSDGAQDAQRPDRALVAIALYKFSKTIACLLLVLLALRLLDPARASGFDHWLQSLHSLTRYDFAARLVDHLLGFGSRQFAAMAVIASAYALLYLVQGCGLWARKRWAEWLVVVETGMLLPLEMHELALRFTLFKLVVLVANLAIVAYLAQRLWRRKDA